jgi:hypothetical protein
MAVPLLPSDTWIVKAHCALKAADLQAPARFFAKNACRLEASRGGRGTVRGR